MLALLILLIENQDVFLNHGDTLENPAWMVYRKFLFAVVAYYITDIFWGLIEAHRIEDSQKTISSLLDNMPVIALTANAFDEDVQRSMQAGMNAHLTKPVESDQLIGTLGELIYEAQTRA